LGLPLNFAFWTWDFSHELSFWVAFFLTLSASIFKWQLHSFKVKEAWMLMVRHRCQSLKQILQVRSFSLLENVQQGELCLNFKRMLPTCQCFKWDSHSLYSEKACLGERIRHMYALLKHNKSDNLAYLPNCFCLIKVLACQRRTP
jgi:hypothetical protein